MRRLLLGVLTLAAAVSSGPSAANAAGTPPWAAAETVSASGETTNGFSAVAVIDETYGVTAVWATSDTIRTAHRAPGGAWGPAETIGSAPDSVDVRQGGVVSAPNGDVTAVWSASDGTNGWVESARRAHDTGVWTTTRLSEPGSGAYQPSVVGASASKTYALWAESDGTDYRLRLGVRAAGASDWDKEWVTPPGAETGYPILAVNADDDVAVSWGAHDSSRNTYAMVRENGTWGSPANFGKACPYDPPAAIAAAPDGGFVLAFTECLGVDDANDRIRTATYASGGPTWTTDAGNRNADEYGRNPEIVVNGQGDTLVSWWRVGPGATFAVAAASKPAGGTWGPPNPLTDPSGVAIGMSPIALPNSTFLLPFAIGPSNAAKAQAYDLIPDGDGGTWSNLAIAPDSTHVLNELVATADSAGDVVAAWNTTDFTVSVAIADGTPPHLTALSVPGSATAGEAVGFSVTPTDDWSQVASTTWNFGDGSTSSVNSPTHTFDAPGTYAVRLSVIDTNGNEATTTRQIAVTAPATPPTVNAPKPAVEVQLRDNRLIIAAAVRLRPGARCRGKGRAVVKVDRKTYKATLTLKGTAKACVASGRITLKSAPKPKATVRVRITAPGATARLLTAKRT